MAGGRQYATRTWVVHPLSGFIFFEMLHAKRVEALETKKSWRVMGAPQAQDVPKPCAKGDGPSQ